MAVLAAVLINTFLSKLRGPEQRLSFLGAPVCEVIPVGAISGNITVAFAALSYAGAADRHSHRGPGPLSVSPGRCRRVAAGARIVTGGDSPHPSHHDDRRSWPSPDPSVNPDATISVVPT